ncbi:hypothetical protein Tsubulata_001802 [Turnera subulata]|uniref:Sugar phosphate transporter domain-containing protein n=1 Tax=Turnera subulata TaxID=218843 RepID=A0A9Q0J821_9ROSI|nr:hypothetical protein Tsubulata_001802 [Turnera subulata]
MDSEKALPVSDPLRSKDNKLRNESSAPMTRKGAYAAISYMASAVLLVMFNKAALSSYSFPYANIITLFQMISSCLLLYAMKVSKAISFTTGEVQSKSNNPVTVVPLKTLLHTSPMAFSYLLYMLVTMESVRGINVPMYTTLRRTTVAFTMIVEYLLAGQKHSSAVLGRIIWICVAFYLFTIEITKDFISVGVILLGAFVAGCRDLSFDARSYGIVFLANICTAVYLTSIARIASVSIRSNRWRLKFMHGLRLFVGIVCLPILFLWTAIRGDLQAMMDFPYLLFPGFQAVMLSSCIMAFLINYFVFLNTTLNSALTQTICGNLKDFFTIGLGWLLFGGLPFDLMNVAGQSLGFLGSCLYAYCKLRGK